MKREMIYTYDGSFEGFLCCIFDSYANREHLTAILCQEDEPPTLFPVRAVQTDLDHARRVLRKVAICSGQAADLVRRGFLTCLPERELYLYRLVVKLLEQGPGFLRNASDETLYPIWKAVRHLNGEAHLLKGFVRFSDLGGVLGSEIAPKNRVLPILRPHFCARYRSDAFFIYDRTHHEALFHVDGRAAIQPLADFQMAPPDEAEARYRLLWKRFYDTVAIQERYNPKCRMTHMPKRYRDTMTEFQDERYFTAKSSLADAGGPGAPGGISAPEKPSRSELSAPESIP